VLTGTTKRTFVRSFVSIGLVSIAACATNPQSAPQSVQAIDRAAQVHKVIDDRNAELEARGHEAAKLKAARNASPEFLAAKARANQKVVCKKGDDCDVAWSRATNWLQSRSAYKIRMATDTMLETYGPSHDLQYDPAFIIQKQAMGKGRYEISLEARCASGNALPGYWYPSEMGAIDCQDNSILMKSDFVRALNER
jgi:hypothetical protein